MMAQQKLACLQKHHEVVIVGFGPAAVSLGIALREKSPGIDLAFIESHSKSAWKPLPDLPGHVHMGFNFLRDLITLQNPRSRFTFIQFLHQRKLLVDFTNLSSMEPNRALFEEYIAWCAKSFEQDVQYSIEILSVEPAYSDKKKINGWNLLVINKETQMRKLFTGKRVVICLEQQQFVPPALSSPSLNPMVVHSSNCMRQLEQLTAPSKLNINIAIIGQTPAAAELFEELYDIRADRSVTWFVEDSAFQIDAVAALNAHAPLIATSESKVPPELKTEHPNLSKPSTQAIGKALIDRIYETQYAQSIKQPDPKEWQYRVEFDRSIIGAKVVEGDRVQLKHKGSKGTCEVTTGYDLVICATGFSRLSPESFLPSLASKRLLDGSSLTVNSEYAVNLRRGVLEPGVGMWCIGSIGETEQAVGEASFNIMSERSARIAESLSKCKDNTSIDSQPQQTVQAQL